MRPHILVNIHYLEIGGAETSLIGLLCTLNPKEVDVDLLINDPRGKFMRYVPEWVNILKAPEGYSMIERPLKEIVKKGYLKIAAARLFAKYKFHKYYRNKQPISGDAIFGYVGKYTTNVLPSLKKLGEYDLAISYVTPHNIVADKINARKKIAWIHTDYSKIDVDTEIELPVWSAYDKIVSISPDVSKSFLKVFPSLEKKIIEIENFLPIELIKNKSLEFNPKDMPKEYNFLNLLTIGRYCEAKRIDEIPIMAKILKDSGVHFKWYIIGYGNQDELNKIKNQIFFNKVEQEMILLGKKENPYPYINACDIYVQPSRYEGKSITVREAQLLGKPVVITNYPTANSQIENGVDGFIGPYTTKEFTKYLVKVINDQKNIDKIRANLTNMIFVQEENINALLSLTRQS